MCWSGVHAHLITSMLHFVGRENFILPFYRKVDVDNGRERFTIWPTRSGRSDGAADLRPITGPLIQYLASAAHHHSQRTTTSLRSARHPPGRFRSVDTIGFHGRLVQLNRFTSNPAHRTLGFHWPRQLCFRYAGFCSSFRSTLPLTVPTNETVAAVVTDLHLGTPPVALTGLS